MLSQSKQLLYNYCKQLLS